MRQLVTVAATLLLALSATVARADGPLWVFARNDEKFEQFVADYTSNKEGLRDRLKCLDLIKQIVITGKRHDEVSDPAVIRRLLQRVELPHNTGVPLFWVEDAPEVLQRYPGPDGLAAYVAKYCPRCDQPEGPPTPLVPIPEPEPLPPAPDPPQVQPLPDEPPVVAPKPDCCVHLESAVAALQQQIANIQITAGPVGPEGPQGPPGVKPSQWQAVLVALDTISNENAKIRVRLSKLEALAVQVNQQAIVQAVLAKLDTTVSVDQAEVIAAVVAYLKQHKLICDDDHDCITEEELEAILKTWCERQPVPAPKPEDPVVVEPTPTPLPVIPKPQETVHMIVVADHGASYWPRLDDYVQRARQHFSAIRVAPPPSDQGLPLPQLIVYRNSVWERQIIGERNVIDALRKIYRGKFSLAEGATF